MYKMTEKYYTGIDMIDEEHEQLFAYADEIYELLHNDFIPDKYDQISNVIELLADYTKKHFADEEEYMESISYKKLFTQKIQHKYFIEKLELLHVSNQEEEKDQDEVIGEMLEFLVDWLLTHILELDTQIGK